MCRRLLRKAKTFKRREAKGLISKKMKSMLQQFKAAKEAKQQQQNVEKSKSRSKSPDIEAVKRNQLETLLRPIELLRYYVKSGKDIQEEDDLIVFEKICYPKNTTTNYRVTRTSNFEPEFYSGDKNNHKTKIILICKNVLIFFNTYDFVFNRLFLRI